jgi:hypothetical protein
VKNFDSVTHFRLLRLAQFRGLQCRALGAGVYAVTSHSREGHEHKVDVPSGMCECESRVYCSHQALAFDRYMLREADEAASDGYLSQLQLDFATLNTREDLQPSERKYLRWAREREEARRRGDTEDAAVMAAPVSTKKVERVRGFQI